jgi:DMSO/TMAO reductase YedYZ molybdopterin-dependent catalytic subunit/thiosulfate reductase cytochrome b subunit
MASDNGPGPTPRRDFESSLTKPSDTIDVAEWAGSIPQVGGTPPHVRVGRRWVNLLWSIPIAVVLVVVLVAVAKGLRNMPAVQDFVHRYPGTIAPSPHPAYLGLPSWVRWQHFFNLFFMAFIIRSGVQILADHPRLYWTRHSTPGREWLRFQKPVPPDPMWTAKQDSVKLPGQVGLPGIRHSIGLARWWHFSFDAFFLLNGVVFYVLLFATPQWQRIVPTTWRVFPSAGSVALQYLSLQWPYNHGWVAYNGLQQLAYFITVFVAAPLALLTGLGQSPAVSNRLTPISHLLSSQVARSIHFLVLCWFLMFIFMHTAMIWTTGVLTNLNHITLGNNTSSWAGFGLYVLWMAVVVAAWIAATPLTLRHPRTVQRVGSTIIGPVEGLFEHIDPNPRQYTANDISPHFWLNGKMPESDEFRGLVDTHFADYKLPVYGLVANPHEFTLDELRALPHQHQITQHFCIQGWSGVAKWGGVPVRELLSVVEPTPDARYVVFYSFGEGADGGTYYDAHELPLMYRELSLLALEMNDEPLPVAHGAPIRLRNEVELGFKQVKWISAIELVADFHHIGGGHGGYNEDHEFYGYRQAI